MKKRLITMGVLLALCFSLCSCTATQKDLHLKGKQTEYSKTIAYADNAWGGVQVVKSDGIHTIKNQRAQLEFDQNANGLYALSSLQTGETILQNTVQTTLTAKDGTIGHITGGTDTVVQGDYFVTHSRTDSALQFPGNPEDAEHLKEFDLTEKDTKTAFSVLKHDVSIDDEQTGLKISSKGKNRSQFGARYLNLDLGTADRYYLSITLKATDISGLKCYFSTSKSPLTEDTLLGTLSLKDIGNNEFVTLTAEIKNELWSGKLQTLLFRMPEGETGSVEISRIAILKGNDPLIENVADTQWTVYSDRIYFSQNLNLQKGDYTTASTVISLNKAKCKEVSETENAIAIKLIDGSVLGFVRPNQGTLTVTEQDRELHLVFHWDLSEQNPSIALRIYLNYTDDLAELEQIAIEERTPLAPEEFQLTGAEWEGYDFKNGFYRLKQTEKNVTVSIKKNDRTVYLHLSPEENAGWKILDKKGNLLPIFSETVFPLCPDRKKLTVQLIPENEPQSVEIPPFFSESGLVEQSRSTRKLNGLYTQESRDYVSADQNFLLSLTAKRLHNGNGTVYDVEYQFYEKTKLTDVNQTFSLFSFELSSGFDNYFYWNKENQSVTVSAEGEEVSSLGDIPYVGLSSESESAGWILPKGEMTVGGIPSTALLCLRYEKPNQLYLSLNYDEITFEKGDTISVQIIRWEESTDENALKSLRDGGNFRLIQTEPRETKTFTVSGMEETVLVQVEGFERYTFPKINANGEKFTPEYHVYVDQKGYYGFAFSVTNGTKLEIKD